MEIEKVTERIVRRFGSDILCNKDVLCNCIEDVLPDVPEYYRNIRMVYDESVGKLLFAAVRASTEERDSYKKEIRFADSYQTGHCSH